MPYLEITDFRAGLDTRRPAAMGEAGSLVRAENVVVTRGGDLQARKGAVLQYTLPAGSFGLKALRNKVFVFGSAAAPTGLPGDIIYTRLQHPDTTPAMTALLDVQSFNGRPFTLAEFDDGSVYPFYGTTVVAGLVALAESIASLDNVAVVLADKLETAGFIAYSDSSTVVVTAPVPGTAFTISAAATGTGTASVTTPVANVAPVAEVRATASFTVTGGAARDDTKLESLLAGTTELLTGPVLWLLDNEATAAAIAADINDGTHGYTATSAGAVVTIKAPVGQGAAANGRVLTPDPAGNMTVGGIVNFAGGVDAVDAVAQTSVVTLGTYAHGNTYTITIDGVSYRCAGRASGMPRIACTFGNKMYVAIRSLVYHSGVGDATVWANSTSAPGFGYINVATEFEGASDVTAIGAYQGRLALMSRYSTQLWTVDADPDLNALYQVLDGTGTQSPRSAVTYGSADLIYLSRTGIRSLRARDSSNAAYVDDVGNRIDQTVLDALDAATPADIEAAASVVDPVDGRYWLALGSQVFVFSYFPGAKISAWTEMDFGVRIDAMTILRDRVLFRSGNDIYVYGGNDGTAFPPDGATEFMVETPFLSVGRPATKKMVEAVDVVCSGNWRIEILFDPNDIDRATPTRPPVVYQTTAMQGRIPIGVHATHFAVRATSVSGGGPTLSSLIVHFQDGEAS